MLKFVDYREREREREWLTMTELNKGTNEDYNDYINKAGPLNFDTSHCTESNVLLKNSDYFI